MRRWLGTRRLAAVLALGAVVVPAPVVTSGGVRAGAGQAGAAGDPTLTVEPGDDLVDGQLVTASASGAPDSRMYLMQCLPDATTVDGCDQHGLQLDADNGRGEARLFVHAVVEIAGRDVDCRPAGACVLGLVYSNFEAEPAVLASAPLAFEPDGPLAPPPSLTLDPAEDLVDGQTVQAIGRGLVHGDPEGSSLLILQCAAGARSEDDCMVNGVQAMPLDEPGAFAWDVPVLARIATPAQGTVDCREPGACVVVATNRMGSAEVSAIAPLAFDPAGPMAPPGTVVVVPSEGLVDGQVVRVEGEGLGPAGGALGSTATIYQCVPARPSSLDRCRPAQADIWVEDGTLSTDVRLFARVATPDGMVDCRTSAEPCVLTVSPVALGSPWEVEVELGFATGGPLLPDPRITVTPTRRLHDFATLTVDGTRFDPGAAAEVRVCRADREAGSQALCDVAELPTAGADGAFTLDITGWSTFTVSGADGDTAVDCRRRPGCVVTATETERGQRAAVPIAFGPPDAPRGRYRAPVFAADEIEVDRDIVYRETVDSEGEPVQLELDIYRPGGEVDAATRRPVVVWMHGGGFTGGGRSDMAPLAVDSARRGYVAVSLQYRVRSDDVYEAAIDAYEDATTAVEWLQAHAADWGIDPGAIVAGGWSAGAITATNLAYAPGQIGPPTSLVAGAISLAGAFFDPDDPSVPFPRPLPRPDPGEPPVIAFHPTADTVIPAFGSLDRMCPLVRRAGIVCEHVSYEGVAHLILQSGYHRDYIRRSHDFLADQVLGPRGWFDVTAEGAGPYEVRVGSTITLGGSGSGEGSQGEDLTYAWSPANRVSDPTSPTPTLTGVRAGTETLTLTVTSSHGIVARDAVTVTTRRPHCPQTGTLSGAHGGAPDRHSSRPPCGDGCRPWSWSRPWPRCRASAAPGPAPRPSRPSGRGN